MKIKQLLDLHAALTRLSQQKVSPRLAYNIQKNLRLLQPEVDSFDKVRVAGMEALGGKLNEAKRQYEIPEPEQANWQRQYDELVETEVTVSLHRLDMESLERDNVKIMAFDMSVLVDWILEVADEETK